MFVGNLFSNLTVFTKLYNEANRAKANVLDRERDRRRTWKSHISASKSLVANQGVPLGCVRRSTTGTIAGPRYARHFVAMWLPSGPSFILRVLRIRAFRVGRSLPQTNVDWQTPEK